MMNHLSGKHRLWIVIGIAWVVFWSVAFSGERDPFLPIFVVGVCPVLIVIATLWIRSGFNRDKRVDELEHAVLKLHFKESIRDSYRRGLSPEEAKAEAQPFIDRLAGKP